MTINELRKVLESMGLNIQIPGYGQLLLDACHQETEKMICPKADKKNVSKLRGKKYFNALLTNPRKRIPIDFLDMQER